MEYEVGGRAEDRFRCGISDYPPPENDPGRSAGDRAEEFANIADEFRRRLEGSEVAAHGVLYILTMKNLFAIAKME